MSAAIWMKEDSELTTGERKTVNTGMLALDRKFGSSWREKATKCGATMAAYYTKKTMIGYETKNRKLIVYALFPNGEQVDVEVADLPVHIGLKEQSELRAAMNKAMRELDNELRAAGIDTLLD